MTEGRAITKSSTLRLELTWGLRGLKLANGSNADRGGVEGSRMDHR